MIVRLLFCALVLSVSGCASYSTYPLCYLNKDSVEDDIKIAETDIDNIMGMMTIERYGVTRDVVITHSDYIQHKKLEKIWPSVGCVSCSSEGCRDTDANKIRSLCVKVFSETENDGSNKTLLQNLIEKDVKCH